MDGNTELNFAPVRWHQTLDVGYLPNEQLPDSFMATAIDTIDHGNIHSNYKNVISKRLVIAAMGQVSWALGMMTFQNLILFIRRFTMNLSLRSSMDLSQRTSQ